MYDNDDDEEKQQQQQTLLQQTKKVQNLSSTFLYIFFLVRKELKFI